MGDVLIAVAFVVGYAAGIVSMFWRVSKHASLKRLVKVLEGQLDTAAWQLGGRLRTKAQPPIYVGPPGTTNIHTCDEARQVWMETACLAAQRLRAAGLTADDIYPDVQATHPPGV